MPVVWWSVNKYKNKWSVNKYKKLSNQFSHRPTMTMEGEKGERDISTNARQIMITSDVGEKPFVFICVTRQ